MTCLGVQLKLFRVAPAKSTIWVRPPNMDTHQQSYGDLSQERVPCPAKKEGCEPLDELILTYAPPNGQSHSPYLLKETCTGLIFMFPKTMG